jgi:gamma-glutamyl:cysteine ligase YbdK (ATP-grasp superfamily)
MRKGDTLILEFTVTENSTAKDITGATVKWQAARTVTSASVVSKSTGSGITLTDPTNGVLQVSIASADTKDLSATEYHHELEVTDASSNIHTAAVGTMTLVEDLIAN